MRIPEIQAELLTIAHYLGSERIAVLARALSRRKGEKGKKVSATMTPELRARSAGRTTLNRTRRRSSLPAASTSRPGASRKS